MPDLARSRTAGAALLASALLLTGPAAAWAEGSITLDFVRHGEAGNSSVIDNSVPGPPLTAAGAIQAHDVAGLLAGDDIDGIYSSAMTRAQETADPLAVLLGMSVPVPELSGLNEIDAGIYAGWPVDIGGLPIGAALYAFAPFLWTLGLYFVPQLGSSDVNGMVFEDRFSDAVQTIYNATATDGTDAVFAHEGSIAFWTLMNVDNPDFGLMVNQALTTGELLDYTGVVEVQGSPEDGWTLISWDGIPVPRDPGLLTDLFVDFRDLITAPQMALYHIWEALLTGDAGAISDALSTGFNDVGAALAQFPAEVLHDLFGTPLF